MSIVENKEICAKCGGKCCFRCPGASFPEDWGFPGPDAEARLLAALQSGKWKIDWWEGDPRKERRRDLEVVMANLFSEDASDAEGPEEPTPADEDDDARFYFVRPHIKAATVKGFFHDGWGGCCTFLTKKGCQLTLEHRPLECKTLAPIEGGPCVGNPKYQKRMAAIAWEPYREFFEKLRREPCER